MQYALEGAPPFVCSQETAPRHLCCYNALVIDPYYWHCARNHNRPILGWNELNVAELRAAIASFKARFGVTGEQYRHHTTGGGGGGGGGGSGDGGGRLGNSGGSSSVALHPRLDDAAMQHFAAGGVDYRLDLRVATQMWMDLTPITRLLSVAQVRAVIRGGESAATS